MLQSMQAWVVRTVRGVALGAVLLALQPVMAEPASGSLGLLPLRVAPRIEPVFPGYLELLRAELTQKGVVVGDGGAARGFLREALEPLTPESALAWAARSGHTSLLLVAARERGSELEITLRLYDVRASQLLAVTRAHGEPRALATWSDRALAELEPALGISRSDASAGLSDAKDATSLDDYASASRALEALDADQLGRAWRLAAMRPSLGHVRRSIQARAKQPGVEHEERVRLLADMGDPETAWSMIFPRAEAQLSDPQADVDVMLAAGQVQLERGELAQAQDFLKHALELAPERGEVHEELGRLHALEQDLDAARVAYERARELVPSVEGLERLAAVLPSNEARGIVLLEAGQLASAELRTEQALALLKRAREASVELAAPSLEAEAQLHRRLLQFAPAAASIESAIEIAGPTPERLHLRGESARALGDVVAAEGAYRQALELEPENATALRELGSMAVVAGQHEQGIEQLERAVDLVPEDPLVLRELARARRAIGDTDGALISYRQAELLGSPEAEDLVERATLERELELTDNAIQTLQQAAELEPGDAEVYGTLAELHRASGNEQEAQRYDSFVLTFAGAHYKKALGELEEAPHAEVSVSLDLLARSFVEAAPSARRVMVFEIFEPRDRITQLLDWVRPRTPDHAEIERSLASAFSAYVEVVPRVEPEGYYAELVARLRRFDDAASRDPAAGVMLNAVHEIDASLLARLERRPAADPQAPPACGLDAYYVIEARLLSGRMEGDGRILANTACLQNASAHYARWNPRAIALLVLLLTGIVYPLIRGWGHVRIEFKLPPKTRPMFSVRLSRRKPKLKDDAPTSDERWKIREKLQALNKNEKRLLDGHTVEFFWIAARRRPYYITVRGPLVDHHTAELIGSFNAEKLVTIERGKKLEIEFDMCPKQACIEVRVVSRGGLIPDARVGLRADVKSVRFTRGRPAFLYLDPGSYVIAAGAAGTVAEKVLHVPDRDPIQLTLDLYDDAAQVFTDCEDAVTPYLEGHFEGAARALEAARQKKRATQVRALLQLPPNTTQLVREILIDARPDAGEAPVPADPTDSRSASALREAGRHDEAARGFLAQGMLREAAEAFMSAYDWDRAADCYRKLEDDAGLLEALEKAGDGYEAASVAARLANTDRALSNLKWVDRRHPNYTEACLLMGDLLAQRGDIDLALEKFEEALSLSSSRGIPIESQEQYARLLEDAGRIEQAIEVYRGIRRIDHDRTGIKERIEALSARRSQLATHVSGADDATIVGKSTPNSVGRAEASRYEVVSELGRGAMGIVYKARDSVLGRMVALKKLPENMREHELAVEYFLREARSAAALNHPNIVTVYDAGQDRQAYFISMECLEGTPLDAVLARVGKLSARDTAILGVQAATGLHYAHAQRIIHRDIKASNLFYTKDRVVKLMDFGLAKAVEEVRKQASVIAGTPYYMPPEQAIGGIVDHRSDIYSLGVTLFQFCTGTVPFQQGDVIYHHAHTPPPDVRERVPELPESLALLIRQMMAKDPDARVQSAEEVAQRLREIVAELQRG